MATRLSVLFAFVCWSASPAGAGLLDGLLGGGGTACTPSVCGSFGAPFAEPSIAGHPTSEKCLPGSDGELICKPAAGTMALLHDGRVLYWDALEGTERVQFSVILEFGDQAANDQSRLLTLGAGGPSWTQPAPPDGGANPGGTANTPLLPNLNTNDDQGAGALFCAALTQLADGRILAAGGTNYYSEPGLDPLPVGLIEIEGLKNTRIFNPADDHWAQTDSMAYGRWYPTLVTLPDGDVLVASGVTKLVKPIYPEQPLNSGRNVVQTETFDVGCGRWSENGPLGERTLPTYPRMHLLPDGQVYYNAGGQAFDPFGYGYDMALWNIVATYDPATRAWNDLAYAGLPLELNQIGLERLVTALNLPSPLVASVLTSTLQSLVGTTIEDPVELLEQLGATLGFAVDPDAVSAAIGSGFRGSTFSVMLPLEPDASGAYTAARLLTAGGVLGAVALASPGTYLATDLSRVDTVTLGADGPRYRSRLTRPLSQPRWFSTAVLLADGSVLALSGADRDEVALPGLGVPVRRADRFDPATELLDGDGYRQQPAHLPQRGDAAARRPGAGRRPCADQHRLPVQPVAARLLAQRRPRPVVRDLQSAVRAARRPADDQRCAGAGEPRPDRHHPHAAGQRDQQGPADPTQRHHSRHRRRSTRRRAADRLAHRRHGAGAHAGQLRRRAGRAVHAVRPAHHRRTGRAVGVQAADGAGRRRRLCGGVSGMTPLCQRITTASFSSAHPEGERSRKGAAVTRWDRRVLRLGVLLIAAALSAAPPAAACAGHAFVRAVLDPRPAALDGMRVEVHETMGAQLALENRSGRTVEVLDAAGEAFVRIGPNGVEGNLAAPTWYASYAPAAVVPAAARTGATPRWVRVTSAPAFGWFDPRLDGGSAVLPPEVLAERAPADLGEWVVPLRVDGAPTALRGRFRYEPPTGAAIARLTSAAAAAPGVRVTLLPGDPAGLMVANAGDETLTVLGLDGEPFLRIGPGGVAANLRSRTWRESGRAGRRQVEAGNQPRWQAVAGSPRYGWVEPRTALAAAPAGAAAEGVLTWSVPMRLGDTPLAVTGTTRWQSATSRP